jgi:hypothetical protein
MNQEYGDALPNSPNIFASTFFCENPLQVICMRGAVRASTGPLRD